MILAERLFWAAAWLFAATYCFMLGYGTLEYASHSLPWPLRVSGWLVFGLPAVACVGGAVKTLATHSRPERNTDA